MENTLSAETAYWRYDVDAGKAKTIVAFYAKPIEMTGNRYIIKLI